MTPVERTIARGTSDRHQDKNKHQYYSNNGTFDMEAFISANHLNAQGPVSWNGSSKWTLDHCPFNPEHTGTSAALFLSEQGPGFKCLHVSCADHHWADLRELLEPGVS